MTRVPPFGGRDAPDRPVEGYVAYDEDPLSREQIQPFGKTIDNRVSHDQFSLLSLDLMANIRTMDPSSVISTGGCGDPVMQYRCWHIVKQQLKDLDGAEEMMEKVMEGAGGNAGYQFFIGQACR